MEKRRPRRYGEEFRAEAVRFARESDSPQKEVAGNPEKSDDLLRQGRTMRFSFIQDHARHSVVSVVSVFSVVAIFTVFIPPLLPRLIY